MFNNYNRLIEITDGWIGDAIGSVGGGQQLSEVLSYCLFPGGKRLRPVLVAAVGEALGLQLEQLRSLAVAVEFVHTSSLIHDDLPALDNDDERRGRPSCHKQFGEDLAVLAGDLLLAAAFRVVSEAEEIDDRVRVLWCRRLSATIADLCEGQVMDLREKIRAGEENIFSRSLLRRRDNLKTGALFQTAIVGPVDCLPADENQGRASALGNFANHFGQLFQVTDDLLDLPSDAADELRRGLEADSERLFSDALKQLAAASLQAKGEFLRELCVSVKSRKS